MSSVLIGEILSVTMFVATIGAVLVGYPVAFTLAGVGLMFAGARDVARRIRPDDPRGAHRALLRHHDQRDAGGGAAVRLHGRDARALEDRRGAAHDDGRALRRAARRPRLLGRDRRRAAGGVHRHRRRHGGHDGPAVAAGDDARGLRPEARRRHDLRRGHARADHPAVDGADLRRRHPAGRQPAGAARARQHGAGPDLGRPAVRGRDHSRA